MTTWTHDSYTDTLAGSNELLHAAHALSDALGAGGGATSPDDVLKALQQVADIVEKMKARL